MLLYWRREFGENMVMAFGTLWENKLRSMLTMIGIFIAVVAVVLVVAFMMGINENVKENVRSFGTNTAFFNHRPSGPQFGRTPKHIRMRKKLNHRDYKAVREACEACQSVTVSLYPNVFGPHRARYKSEEVIGFDFRGATEDFFLVYANAAVGKGRAFTAAENLHRSEVAVLGEDMAKGLFADLNAIDKQIIVNGRSYTVIGVFEKPAGGFGGGPGNQTDNRVTVPYWTAAKHYPGEQNHGIRIEAFEGRLPAAIDQTRVALRLTRKVPVGEEDDFGYTTAEAAIKQFQDLVWVVALVVAVVASVGLMVGGIGVMNIMLVSVTERTREIGIRKAIGARRRDIVWQFLIEAMTLTGLAGILALLFVWLVVVVVRSALPSIPAFVPAWVVVLALAVASSVGLFFGMYPAVKAARLDPIDALRYE